MKARAQFVVYVAGAVAFGLFYEQVKAALGGKWLFLLAAVAYLVFLRVVGGLVAKFINPHSRGRDA